MLVRFALYPLHCWSLTKWHVVCRWKVWCSIKPPFPLASIGYRSENVEKLPAVTLRDPAVLELKHARMPPGVQYAVKYYSDAYDPASFAGHYADNLKTLSSDEGCSHTWLVSKNRLFPTTLHIRVMLEFDANQAYTTTFQSKLWALKMTLTAPTGLPLTTIQTSQGQSTTYQYIQLSCSPAECGGDGTPNCEVSYSYLMQAVPDQIFACQKPCQVLMQDADHDFPGFARVLLDVHARCLHTQVPYSRIYCILIIV